DEEQVVQDVDNLVDAAETDVDAATTADNRLLDLRTKIDDIEDSLAWPMLVRETEELMREVREVVTQHGNDADRRALADHEAAIRSAIDTGDADLLRQRAEEIRMLGVRALDHSGVLQRLIFEDLRKRQNDMQDRFRATRLIAEGNQAVANNEND